MRESHQETMRLAAVKRCGLFGAARSDTLDGLARIAASAFGTPMASVTLIHRDRQWFAGRTGLAEPGTSRAASFSARLLDDPHPLVVADTRDDPMFRYLPHVNATPPIRFYAGVPLVDGDGQMLGSVAVFDQVPRLVDGTRMELLQTVSAQATAYLRSARDAERLRRARADLTRLREQQDDMIATVSHELRTPLATMLGYAEMLAEHPSLQHHTILDPLGDAGRRLLGVLETILATTGSEDRTPVPTR